MAALLANPDLVEAASRRAFRDIAAEAVRRAGGAEKLAAALAEMGFAGRKGDAYVPESIAHWIAGRSDPGGVVMAALAYRWGISVDRAMAMALEAIEAGAALRANDEE